MNNRIAGFLVLIAAMLPAGALSAQGKSQIYRACLLKDSIDGRVEFIRLNAARIFTDTAECKRDLLDTLAMRFVTTGDKRYLVVLNTIKQNSKAKIEDDLQDVLNSLVESGFASLLDAFYQGRGGFSALENEVVLLMNTIVGGRPYKQKYLGLLNVEIAKAQDSKDKAKETYLLRFRQRIEADKIR